MKRMIEIEKLSSEMVEALKACGALTEKKEKSSEGTKERGKRSQILKSRVFLTEESLKVKVNALHKVAALEMLQAAGDDGLLGSELEFYMSPEQSGFSEENWTKYFGTHILDCVKTLKLRVEEDDGTRAVMEESDKEVASVMTELEESVKMSDEVMA